jgi:hypothetical protein
VFHACYWVVCPFFGKKNRAKSLSRLGSLKFNCIDVSKDRDSYRHLYSNYHANKSGAEYSGKFSECGRKGGTWFQSEFMALTKALNPDIPAPTPQCQVEKRIAQRYRISFRKLELPTKR